MNPKTFCVVPWAHVRVNPNGELRPCCKIDVKWSGTRQLTDINDFNEYWNSDQLQQLRLDLNQGVKNTACNTCWQDETAGKSSLRIEYNKRLGKYIDLQSINASTDGLDTGRPVAMDLNLSNICNYKCVMCVPELSSKIAQEQQQYRDQYKSLPFIKIKSPSSSSNWPEQDFFQTLMQQIGPGLRILELKGGEPLLVKNVKKTIHSIENKSECTLAITTNGSIDLDDSLLKSLKDFKRIWLFVSVDGIGEIGEYIRYGSSWTQVEKVIKQASNLSNCTFRFSTVLQFSSAVTFPAIFEYAMLHGHDIEILNCQHPKYLSINAIPTDTAQNFVAWVKQQQTIYPENSVLKSVLGYFNQYVYDPDLFAQCQSYFSTLDKIRGNSCNDLEKILR
jgi:hypothetical protein